jgi:uncharacterized protein YlxW (UPF0749 family)
MADELPPSLFNILREDLKTMGERLDKLVTAEAFTTERKRVDDKFADQGRDIQTEKREREADVLELTTRIEAATNSAKEAKETQEARRVTFRQGMQIAVVSVLGGGVVSLVILIVQNTAHLG